MKKCFWKTAVCAIMYAATISPLSLSAAREKIPERTGEPYLGAIVVNADTGEVVFEENADAECYPASIVKLMMLLILQERIEANTLGMGDTVKATAEATRIGGSQVWLKEGEEFPVEELLYALIVRSANDAAVALAIHAAGSTEAFVRLMQEKAGALGMAHTVFHTVHGLPPARGQEPDVSTPRDLAILARELLKHPHILKYTSTKTRGFRNDTVEMRSHNNLLGRFEGCDGLKTGYFKLGGYSLAATASRGGNRFIAVIAGAKKKAERDSKTRELLSLAFAKAPRKPTPTPQAAAPAAASPAPGRRIPVGKVVLVIVVLASAGGLFWLCRRKLRGPPPLSGPRYDLK